MTKRIHAKHKIDRRLGENIWGRPKSPQNKREYGPGEHGQRRRGKLSDYGQQLRAKQKLKGYYGNITEKQFKAIYNAASRPKGDTSGRRIWLRDPPLDAIVSYRLKEGDVIEVRDKSKDLGMVLEAAQSSERDVPDYVDVDHGKMVATFTRVPLLSDVPYPVMMEPNLVIEFYSR